MIWSGEQVEISRLMQPLGTSSGYPIAFVGFRVAQPNLRVFVDPFGLNTWCKAICYAGKFIDIHYCNVTASLLHEQECKKLFARSPIDCFLSVETWRKDCIKRAEKKFKDCIEDCEKEEACP